MKSVLISIKPKWCELIASGKKTIEVRKTRPKIECPFKCYIYETKDRNLVGVYKVPYQYSEGYGLSFAKENRGVGKVIGEFTCDRIDEIGFSPYNHGEYIPEDVFEKTCLSFEQMYDYTAEEFTYGWHISDLVIYDTPKELSEFIVKCHKKSCVNCRFDTGSAVCLPKLNRPPQSWCYVEEL